jgi:hypothetical protein
MATEFCLRLLDGGGEEAEKHNAWEHAFVIERMGLGNSELTLGWECFGEIGFGPKTAPRSWPDGRLQAFRIVAKNPCTSSHEASSVS